MASFSNVYDQYDDDGLFLRKELGERGVPAIIKIAANLSGASVKHEDDYAVSFDVDGVTEHRYPIVDAGNTVASAMYFTEYGHGLPEGLQKEAAAKLNQALVSFGFTPPEELTKTAAIEVGYSGEGEDMSLEKLFGFTGSAEDDMELLEGAFDGLTPRGKRRLALQVKEGSANMPESLSDYASNTIGSDFGLGMDTRKLVVGLSPEALMELGEIEKEAAAGTDCEELAEKLASFDERHQITHHYNSVILDPYASVFGSTVKKSASVESAIDIDGREYTSDTIASWAQGSGSGKLATAFGDDFRDQFQADPATVLSSLPVTHKQAIARMIDEG